MLVGKYIICSLIYRHQILNLLITYRRISKLFGFFGILKKKFKLRFIRYLVNYVLIIIDDNDAIF